MALAKAMKKATTRRLRFVHQTNFLNALCHPFWGKL
jgi:hypothetical protein